MVTSQREPLIDPYRQQQYRRQRLHHSTIGPWIPHSDDQEELYDVLTELVELNILQEAPSRYEPRTPSEENQREQSSFGEYMHELSLQNDEQSYVDMNAIPLYRTVHTSTSPHDVDIIRYQPRTPSYTLPQEHESSLSSAIRIPRVMPEVGEESDTEQHDSQPQAGTQTPINLFIPIARSNSQTQEDTYDYDDSDYPRFDDSIFSTLHQGLMITNVSPSAPRTRQHAWHRSQTEVESYTDLISNSVDDQDSVPYGRLVPANLAMSELHEIFSASSGSSREQERADSPSRHRERVEEVQQLNHILQRQLRDAERLASERPLGMIDFLINELDQGSDDDDDNEDGEYKDDFEDMDEEDENDDDDLEFDPQCLDEAAIAQGFLDANGVPCRSFQECLEKAVCRASDANSHCYMTLDSNGVELDDEIIFNNLKRTMDNHEPGER